jgi:hypothetical protein
VIPPAVRRFLDQRIDDVEQLEIVLLLQRHGDRSWSAADVADALGLGIRRVEHQLEALAGRDLLDVRIGGEVRYRFKPASDTLAATARQLADCYRDRRLEIVSFVTTRGPRPLRDFSDAFRLKNRKRDA